MSDWMGQDERDAPRLRVGRVMAVDTTLARVRVLCDADDATVSWWLPVLAARSRGDRAVWLPERDEQVVVLFDERGEFGVVLGAIYSTVDRPPTTAPAVAHVAFRDGTVISYDPQAHRLTVDVRGGDVELRVEPGHEVRLGDAAGLRVPTEQWVLSIFNLHTHTTPAGPSGPPIVTGPIMWPLFTQRSRLA